MTTTATWKTQITADIPDYGSQEVTFTLSGGFFVGGEDEVLPLKTYTMTLDANGNDDGAFYLPTPDNSGDVAANWRIRLPSGEVITAAIAYSATAQELQDILATAETVTDPSAITGLLNDKADKDLDATAGHLAKFDANGNPVDAGMRAGTANGGGAIGNGATTDSGGAIGSSSYATGGGGAVGVETYANNGGGAIGNLATTDGGGGAIGYGTITGRGFAGGYLARASDGDATGIDAIQLGTGTNITPGTLQIYDNQLLDASGNIPAARMTANLGSAAVKDASAFDAAGSAAAAQAAAVQRANHTGTQTADTISDFDTEVSGNADVTANTSARHTHANQSELDLITDGDHDVRTDNPHAVTAAQVSALALTGGQLSGNLGIGTAPSYTLDVNGTCQNTAQRIVGSAPSFIVRNTSYSPRIDFVMGLDSAGTYLASDTEAKHLRLYTRETGSSRTERMRVQDNGLIGINTSSAISQLHVLSMSAATIGQIIQLAASATANALEVRDSTGTTLTAITKNGAWQPPQLADSAAANGTVYYSTDASKLVFKDSSGVVNNLY